MRESGLDGSIKPAVDHVGHTDHRDEGHSVHQKLFAGFFCLLAIVTGISFFSLHSLNRFLRSQEWVKHTYEVEAATQQLLTTLSIAENSQVNYLINQDPNYLKAFNEAYRRVDSELFTVMTLTQDNTSQQLRVVELRPLIRRRLELLDVVLEVFRTQGFAASVKAKKEAASIAMTLKVREKLLEILDAEKRLLLQRNERLDHSTKRTRNALAILVGISILLSVVGFISLLGELKQRHKAEMERDQFFEHSIDMLCIANEKGYFIKLNSAFERILGYSREELLARPFIDFVHPDDLESTLAEVSKLSQGELTLNFENRYKTKKGDYRVLSWKSIPRNGLLYASARDITEQQETQKLLQEQQKQMIASSKLASLGEMASGIAHEINNPLAIIQTTVDDLKEVIEGKESVRLAEINPHLDKITTVVFRIAKIITGLRSFARDQSSDTMQTVSLKLILDDTLALCRERFRNHSVSLDVISVPDELKIHCHSTQISQVLLNLLNNAHDAVQSAVSKKIEIEVKDLGQNCEISVADSGSGIPPEIRQKIFNPFFTTKEIGKGTGLGLSISKGIMESHGGQIFLDPDSNQTRFVILLPKENSKQI